MPLLMVIALALLQGVTEFIPVSSSGHLRLLSAMFGVEDPQTLFDIMLHVGTLAAVFFVYRDIFGRMLLAVGRAIARPTGLAARVREDADLRLALLAVVGTVPTGILGIALGATFEGAARHVAVVGIALIVNAGILLALRALTVGRWAATPERPRRGLEQLRVSDALIVGTAQGLAIFRGISRSGSTITAGLVTGLDREAAAAFSFILSVPAILGALVLELHGAELSGGDLLAGLVGAVVAAISGTLALLVLLRLLRRGRLHLFAWYCLVLGASAIVWDVLT